MMMTPKQDDCATNNKLISIMDNLIQEGHWDKSLFLKATEKEIRNLRDKLSQELVTKENARSEEEEKELRSIIPEGKQIVYVGLYQTDGLKLTQWENALEFLLASSTSKPIYADETCVKDMLLKKGATYNNAYAAMLIDKDDIIPVPEKIVTDKFGHELLTLKEDALKVKNIRYFVHKTGCYILEKKRLIREKNS